MTTDIKKLKQALFKALNPSFLESSYREKWSQENPTCGFCTLLSEATFFIFGGNQSGWTSYAVKDNDGTSHWWLQNKNGDRLDLTAEQYYKVGAIPPYKRGLLGKPCGFMGMRVDEGNEYGFNRKPSNRCQKFLNRVLEVNKVKSVDELRKHLISSNKNKPKIK